MEIEISHNTTYEFDQPVPYALQRLRLKPKDSAGQEILQWDMEIDGGALEAQFEDHHFNGVALVRTRDGATKLSVHCKGRVRTSSNYNGVMGRHRGYIPLWLFRRQTELTKPGKTIRNMLKTLRDRSHENDIETLHELSAFILSQVEYQTGTTNTKTLAEQAAEQRCGVCQDHAHIFISMARELGYPARYVGGYLYMPDTPVQEAGHAWAEAYVEELGWIGFDISNGISPDEKYVRVATGFDYSDAAPITSMSFGAKDKNMHVDLKVQQAAQQQE